MLKKSLAMFLAMAVLLLSLPMSVFASATTELPSQVADKGFTVGETLFETDFTKQTSMPQGWLIPQNSELAGFAGWIPNSVVSYEFTADGLKLTSSGCDGNIFSPTVYTSNYVYEVTLVSTGTGSLGSLINVKPNSGASRFVSYTTGSNTLAGKAHYYNKYNGNNINEGTNFNLADFGIATPTNGTVLTFKSYVFDDVAYCYLNGTYLFSYTVEGNQSAQRLGAFFCNNSIILVSASAKILMVENADDDAGEVTLPGNIAGYKIGETLFNGFADYDLGDLPEGWLSVAGGSVNGNSVGFGANGSTINDVKVVEEDGSKKLHVTSYGCDTFILAPEINASNYIYEATLIGNNGQFIGITNNSWGDSPAEIKSIQWFAVNCHNGPESDSNYWKSYSPAGQNSGRVETDGDIRYTNGVPIKIKLVSLNGNNYYYINDQLASTAAQVVSNVNNGTDRVGFYSFSADFYVKSAIVKELEPTTVVDLPEGVGMAGDTIFLYGDVIYENNFANETVGKIPEGWSAGLPEGTGDNKTSFGWAANKESGSTLVASVIEHSNLGKVVQFGAGATDAFMALPSTGTMNYIYEATVIVNTNGNSIGLANNFYAPTNRAGGVMYTSIYPNSTKKTLYQYRGSGTGGEWNISYNPTNGETLKLKIVSLDGYNYIYYNGVHSATAAWRGGVGDTDHPGFYTYAGNMYITDVKVTEVQTAKLTFDNMSVKVNKDETVDAVYEFSFDKSQEVFVKNFDGDYAFDENSKIKLGYIISVGTENIASTLKVEDVEEVLFFSDEEITQNDEVLVATVVNGVAKEDWNKFINVRPIVDFDGVYSYGDGKAFTVENLANGAYMSASSDEEKTLIKNMFGENSNFVFSDDAKELTFTVYADLHYKAGMYSSSISDLKSIFKRAEDSNSAFVLSSGDMTNDMKGSPELVNAFLGYKTADGRILNAYNVYGNHELETAGNTMQIVTPTLTNDANVHWGDGTIGHDPEDLMIGYYYVDVDGFRLICVDNSNGYNPNHYKNPDGSMGEVVGWEHYLPGSYGDTSAAANATRDFYEGVEAKANTKGGSLGDVQMAWLEEVLLDAADNGLHCIINGHAGYSGLGFGGGSSDAAEVRALYKKANEARPGTVVMSINGHIHTNHQGWNEGVFYFDVNTVRNNWWQQRGYQHYGAEHTYMFEEYDDQGNLIKITEKSLSTLSAATNTWFSEDPLSAVVTINSAGVVTIDGTESRWAYGIEPPTAVNEGTECRITSGVFWDCGSYGHIEEYCGNEDGHYVKCAAGECDYASGLVEKHTYDDDCDTKCNVCETEREAGHTYKAEIKKATLTTDGSIVEKCEHCGDVKSTTVIKAVTNITLSHTTLTYSGKTRTPTAIVKDADGNTLVQDTDYTVTYDSGRKNVGTYNITVTLKGNYEGTKTLSFKINPADGTNYSYKLSHTSLTYSGKTRTPTVTVVSKGGTTLVKDTDYTVTYASGRKNVGTYTVKVTLKGNFKGSKTLSFKINPVDGTNYSYKLSTSSYTYDGKTKTPTVTVVSKGGTTLKKDTDYTVTYASGRKNVGTYTVKVTLKGNFKGSKTLSFKINPVDGTNYSYKLSTTSYTYDGKTKTPTVTVVSKGGTTLKKDTDYTVSYASGRKNVGTYKVTIKLKGNFKGTKTLTFKINPPKTGISKLTAGTKSFTVNITKKTTQTTGYQVQYSTSKSFTSSKTATITKNSTTKLTVKSLSAKKTYYVRVRTYKTVNGVKYYSGWSAVKSVKTK